MNHKKNDIVYLVNAWDRCGTYYVQTLQVTSAGKKQTTAIDLAEGGHMKTFIYAGSYEHLIKADNLEQAIEKAEQIARQMLDSQISGLKAKIGNPMYSQVGLREELEALEAAGFRIAPRETLVAELKAKMGACQ